MAQKKPIFRIALWGFATAALLASLWVQVIEPRMNQTIADTLGDGDYRLVATDGSTFTQETLRGTPSAVFFGFTHCPEVCPTTLGEIAAWQDELPVEGEPLRVFFCNCGPERDTSELLSAYVSWVLGVVGVSGSREEIDKAIRAFRIYTRKVPLNNGDYTMDHSASVLLFDKKGNFFEPIGYQEGFDRAVAKIRRLLKS